MLFDFLLLLATNFLDAISKLQRYTDIPDEWWTAMTGPLIWIYGWQDVFPISEFFTMLAWYIGFEVAIFTLRQALNLFNWLRGTGKGLDI